MAYQKPRKQPEFADLKGILAQTKTELSNATYQTLAVLIDRLTQLQLVTKEQLADINNSISAQGDTILNIIADKHLSFITALDESLKSPNSNQLLAGSGIVLDYSVPNKLTISSTGGSGGYAPMSTGAEPLEIMSDGAGSVLMVGFSE